ncbi:zinc finger protein 271-like [Ambystoma mexicanum]|uniref:zinc finger protein 271-like n=1 Tax=Ambystoma mexicanum TaxID=8296 RepID=UPI0037E896C4
MKTEEDDGSSTDLDSSIIRVKVEDDADLYFWGHRSPEWGVSTRNTSAEPMKMPEALAAISQSQNRSHRRGKEKLLTFPEPHENYTEGTAFGISTSSSLNMPLRAHARKGPAASLEWKTKLHKLSHMGDSTHDCTECGQGFSRKIDLRKHLEIHMNERPYSCEECGQSFRWQSRLDKHLHNHAKEKWYPCSECEKSFSRCSLLMKHQQKHVKGRRHVEVNESDCNHCGERFLQKKDLVEHLEMHVAENRYKCVECGTPFSQKSDLIEHQQGHAQEKALCGEEFLQQTEVATPLLRESGECYSDPSSFTSHHVIHPVQASFTRMQVATVPVQSRHAEVDPPKDNQCGEPFRLKSDLDGPCQTHGTEKSVKCSVCGWRILRQSHLVNHMRNHRRETLYPCSECGESFRTCSLLVTHQQMHTGGTTLRGRFRCNECGRSFTGKRSLQEHLDIHIHETRYPCNECGKSFKQKRSLWEHLRIHKIEMPYTCCTECGQGFSRKIDLRKHLEIHMNERPYSCDECGQSFRWQSRLDKHLHNHAKEKWYPCSECEKSFSRCSLLMKHQQKHVKGRRHVEVNESDCNHCGERFLQKKDLVEHLEMHVAENRYKCVECGTPFSQKSDLIEHQQGHAQEKALCGDLIQQPEITAQQLTETEMCHLICGECGESFDDTLSFKVHQATHAV